MPDVKKHPAGACCTSQQATEAYLNRQDETSFQVQQTLEYDLFVCVCVCVSSFLCFPFVCSSGVSRTFIILSDVL